MEILLSQQTTVSDKVVSGAEIADLYHEKID